MFRKILSKSCTENRVLFEICRTISKDAKIGFVGLGNMGNSMALNIAKKGHPVVAFDLNKESLKSVVEQSEGKIEAAKQLSHVTKDVEAIVTVLPSSPNVLEVYGGSKGLLKQSKKGTIFMDCTTGDPSVAKQMAEEANNAGCVYMDAPISGGVLAARDGNLTFMVGGDASNVKLAEEVLMKMGKKVFHCGPIGTGLAAKICNNMLLAISMIGVSEAMNLGKNLGLEPSTLANIINNATGRCWSSDTYNPVPGVLEGVPASRNYEGGFGCALMTKDLGLSQVASIDTKTNVPLGSAAHQMYQQLCNQGYGLKDFGAVYQFLSQKK